MSHRTPASGRLLLSLLTLLALGGPVRADDREGVEEIETRFATFSDAFREADAATLGSLLAPGYVHTNGGSAPLDRERWLGYVASRREELASGELRLSRYENRDVRIVRHGDAAIVTGVNVSEGVRHGVPFSRRLRFTQVWVQREGVWLRAAFQDAEADPGTPEE